MAGDILHAPLAEHFVELAAGRPLHNFHAVPWPGAIGSMPPELARHYGTLLGADLALVDGSFAGGSVDSFFSPRGPLAAAQRRAADAFGADATFFGTEGTTTSNRIALDALDHAGARVLMDCAAHQSLLFAAEGMDVTATPRRGTVDMPCVDVPATAALLASRAAEGRPFDTLALTATTYDGRRMRLDLALAMFVAASPTTALVVDEAWSALHAFAPSAARSTALAACAALPLRAPVLVTHSAHKTMAALRQGSYLHVLGSEAAIERVRRAVFRTHTTSPSWPILVSLDLARAHAQEQGAVAFARAASLRADFEDAVRRDQGTAVLPAQPVRDDFYEADPLVARLFAGPRTRALRDRLFADHHVLVTYAGDHLIVRVNLGVTPADLEALLVGLRDAADDRVPVRSVIGLPNAARPKEIDPSDAPAVGERSGGYLIPYPPGVPLVRPGEVWTIDHAEALARERARGAEIHRLSALAYRDRPPNPDPGTHRDAEARTASGAFTISPMPTGRRDGTDQSIPGRRQDPDGDVIRTEETL